MQIIIRIKADYYSINGSTLEFSVKIYATVCKNSFAGDEHQNIKCIENIVKWWQYGGGQMYRWTAVIIL